MSKAYLMSAYALTEKRRAKVDIIRKFWDEGTVYGFTSRTGKKLFAVSSGELGYKLGERVEMVKDTGNGYAYVASGDADLMVDSIYTVTPEGVERVAGEHQDLSRAIYVFK